MIYSVIVALALVQVASSKLFTENAEAQKFMWEEFKKAHSKAYSTMEEETMRFGFFIENMKIVDDRNSKELLAGGSAVHGITKFSDLSQMEFEKRYLSADKAMKKVGEVVTELPPYSGPDALVDWSGKLTTPVKDQGYCGSCWAFSATEQIESDVMRTLGKSYVLSPQQITSCATSAYGCNGGWTEVAYSYVKSAGGIELNSDYPYSSYYGATGTCKATASKFVATVTSYTTISGETNMANYVKATGPLSVCLDASSWNSYTGGIMTSCGNNVDHCVQAVGVDTSSYWKVRNSWGTSWGESGYIRLAYGKNTCDITNDPTYAAVKLV